MSGTYSRDLVLPLLRKIDLEGAWRIIRYAHAATPTFAPRASSRFVSDDPASPTVLYLASTLATALAETVIRDLFVQMPPPRGIEIEVLQERAVFRVQSYQDQLFTMIDLRADGCLRLGAPTDAVQAQSHTEGQKLARALHDHHPDIDGIIFDSRLTGETNYALFARATPLIRMTPPEALVSRYDTVDLLKVKGFEVWRQ